MIINGYAHACGEYLTVEKIVEKLTKAEVDMILLTAGQYKSNNPHGMKNSAYIDVLDDAVSKINHNIRLFTSLIVILAPKK